MLPKTMASVGQAAWQAVIDLAVADRRGPRFSASIRAALMRCTQYVHFSITPRLRTVTSGLRSSLRLGVSESLIHGRS